MTFRSALLFGLAVWCAGAAEAGCRIALLLAMDVSRSVDAQDYAIQHDGLIAALADPEVIDLFLRPKDEVALAVTEWSGRGYQEVIVTWRIIKTEADLQEVARIVDAHIRNPASLPTALGRALEHAFAVMQDAPPCARQVLDVSGDGQNNDGRDPSAAYRRNDFSTIIVNGLAIGGHESDIADYYRDQVIRGPGSFVEIAETQADFPEAIRKKLLRELGEQIALLSR